jgi:tRNA (guanine-N7-)-methyltransferase
LDLIFEDGEINDLYIHFPDPWVSPRKPEKRLTTLSQLQIYHRLQRPDSLFEFKTDSRELFEYTLEKIKSTPYRIEKLSWNRHVDDPVPPSHWTQFERIFIRQNLPIHYLLARRI